MTTENRKLHAVPARAAIADLLPLLPNLTDDEWLRRDAEVAAARVRLSDGSARPTRFDHMVELGFPRRAVGIVRAGADLVHPAIGRLRGYVASAEILVLSGPKGCGKTVAATWWAAQRRDRVRFLRASTFAASSRYDDRAARGEWFTAALVLDDLGAEFADSKGSFVADLDELVDVFYGDLRPLLITTNCSLDQFRERYGERIGDRLRECGRWISLSGESLRQRPHDGGPS